MIIIFGCSSVGRKARGAYIHAELVMSSSLDNNLMSTRTVHRLKLILFLQNVLSPSGVSWVST